MDLYQEQIIDLAKHPLNRRVMEDPTLTHSGVNVTCGDHVRLYLRFDRSSQDGIIQDASWEGEGCAISVAAASLLTDSLKGKTLTQAAALKNEDVFNLLGVELGPARVKCGVLCLETLQTGLHKGLQ